MKKIILIVLCGIVCLVIGFFIGRSTIKTETEIKYIPGKTISGSVSNNQFESVKEEIPNKPLLPTKIIEIQYKDTGRIKTITETKYMYQVVDTAAIIEDYIKKRTYAITAFDNTEQGKLLLYPVVQYNKLTGIDYLFTPMQKQRNTYLQKIWQPFVSASYSTFNYIGVGGGIFYHNLGFEYQYQKSLGSQDNGHLFGVKYKF
ncbi:conserved exported hypothetical protein [uncultured Dysgonomonas sp.]|uniref:Uncharacterized protein n=1 Tax=uncultured Dysgonomonas sp. TaxID=206096 RepID=A0A212J5U1_9BACT|nr:hypothetical protein [uncultured Dysgonomonas sp.]SBV94797.1 conserved exported hypothetical protein [uncultured Dysgonomonas sp.]